MRYHLTVKAFDRVSATYVSANSEQEAIEKAHRRAGYSVQAKPRPDLDRRNMPGPSLDRDDYRSPTREVGS